MEDYKNHVLSCLMIDKDADNPCIDFIPIVREHQLFGGKKISSLDSVVKSIHSHLGSSKTRKHGLSLLQELVQQCSTEVFLTHVNTWISLLIQILESHDSEICHQATCQILSEILETSSRFPELSREMANSTVPQIFPLLLESSVNWREAALACIGVCIQNFPGPCGYFKNKLESLIWQEVFKNTTEQNVISCFALLPRCGGGGSHGVKFTESWTEQCDRVLDGLNQTLDHLYEGLETGSGHQNVKKPSELSFPDSEPARGKYLTGHFQTLALCLEALLSEPFPTIVKVPVEDILQTLCRCLAINKNILLSRPTTSKMWLLARLPFIHNSALAVLSCLIRSVRRGLLTHTDVINKLYLETLFSTHWDSVTSGQDCPLRFLRQSVYSGLLLWLQVIGYGTNLITDEKDLVKEILCDLIPITDVVKLNVKKSHFSDGPPAKKKQKGGGYQELGQGIGSQRKVNRSANVDLTVEALNVLAALVDAFGSSWKPKTHKEIVEKIISTAVSVQQSAEAPIPYQSSTCRLALYRTLLACTIAIHPDVPTPLQISMGLFRRGLQDQCLEVSAFCNRAIGFCECIIHPRAPCIRGPSLTQCTFFVQPPGELVENNNSIHGNPFQNLNIPPSITNSSVTHNELQTNTAIHINNRTGDLQNGEQLVEGNSKVIHLKDSAGIATQTEDADSSDEDEDEASMTDPCEVSEMERRDGVSADNDQALMVCDDPFQNKGLSEASGHDEQTQKCTVHVISVASLHQESVTISGGVESELMHGLELESTPELFEQPSPSQNDSIDKSPKSDQSGSRDPNGLPSTSTTVMDQPTAEVEAMLLSFVDADPDSE